MLLVSEREADALLELLWKPKSRKAANNGKPGCEAPVLLLLSCAAASGAPLARCISSSPTLARHARAAPPVPALVSLKLFDGETVYGSEGLFREVHRLMQRKKKVAEELTSARGKQSMLPRSDLERACEDVLTSPLP